jgi:biotin operon repressor
LLTMLAGNRYTSSAVIAARLGVSDQGARIRWHRVREKLRDAGLDPTTVVEVRATGGYRLRLADAPAVEGVG